MSSRRASSPGWRRASLNIIFYAVKARVAQRSSAAQASVAAVRTPMMMLVQGSEREGIVIRFIVRGLSGFCSFSSFRLSPLHLLLCFILATNDPLAERHGAPSRRLTQRNLQASRTGCRDGGNGSQVPRPERHRTGTPSVEDSGLSARAQARGNCEKAEERVQA